MSRNVLYFALVATLVFALTGCGGPAGNKVDVVMTDFAFNASRNSFTAGETYTFTITNNGAVPHEFVIAEPVEGDMHMDEGEMEHEGLIVEVEADELPPGATVTVDVTFPSPAPDHPLEYACHVEGHYEAGMHSPITVK